MRIINKYALLFLLFTFSIILDAQEIRTPISFQGILKEGNNLIINQTVFLKIGLYNDTSATPIYEEVQDTITNEFAIFAILFGNGNPTENGIFESFDEVVWNSPTWLKLQYSLLEPDNYQLLGYRELQAMPYVMYADSAYGSDVGIENLFDVYHGPSENQILKWDGTFWLNTYDVLYTFNTLQSDSSVFSDTTFFAWSMIDPVQTDTVEYSYYLDSTYYSLYSDSSIIAETSLYSDTAFYTLNSLNSWSTTGNISDNNLGKLDSTEFVIKTKNIKRFLIQSDNKIRIGNISNTDTEANLDIKGGFYASGTHQNYIVDTIINNGFYWEPRKSSLVIGNSMQPYFLDTLKGNHSLAGGFQSIANSYSIAWGDSSIASGNNMVVLGSKSIASRVAGTKYATGVVLGFNNIAETYRAVIFGTNNHIYGTGGGNVIIGHSCEISAGSNRISIGSDLINDGQSQFLLGFHLKSSISDGLNQGSSMIGDNSTTTYLEDLGNPGQLLIRADGGTIIYSDSAQTTGVRLFSGSGSWSMLSDINMKENIKEYSWKNNDFEIQNIPSVYLWNYSAQAYNVRHAGVFAQEFNYHFDLKENERKISMVDMDGIIFSGIKHLYESFDESQVEVENIQNSMDKIKMDQEKIIEYIDSKRAIIQE